MQKADSEFEYRQCIHGQPPGQLPYPKKLRPHKRIKPRSFPIVFPTAHIIFAYAWRIPRIVLKWLEHTALSGSKDIYFAMTCGGSIGNAM